MKSECALVELECFECHFGNHFDVVGRCVPIAIGEIHRIGAVAAVVNTDAFIGRVIALEDIIDSVGEESAHSGPLPMGLARGEENHGCDQGCSKHRRRLQAGGLRSHAVSVMHALFFVREPLARCCSPRRWA